MFVIVVYVIVVHNLMIPHLKFLRSNNVIKRGFVILMSVFFALFLTALWENRFDFLPASIQKSDKIFVKVANRDVQVEIADTEEKRSRGLGDRKKLQENSGMLFLFEIPAKYQFWMKDMQFPIDIIWIDENKKIIAISKNIFPDTYPASFVPSDPVKYVLEVNAGWAERNGVKTGDFIEL